jgi:penicillin-binding protein 2
MTGIGQGYLHVTPLQLAVAMARLANHGLRIQPRVLYAVQDARGGPLQLTSARVLGSIPMSRARYWDDVIAALERVVHSSRGTARAIGQDSPYHIAGKTGTSQVFGLRQDEKYDKESLPLELRDHALFIAFAPVGEPRIAVAVVAEHGGSGGVTAAPIARRVLDAYLKAGTS